MSPDVIRDIYSHDFNKLLKAAGLAQNFEAAKRVDPKLRSYWDGIVKDWTEKSRYDRNGRRVGRKKAQNMIEAISGANHGVLQCFKMDW